MPDDNSVLSQIPVRRHSQPLRTGTAVSLLTRLRLQTHYLMSDYSLITQCPLMRSHCIHVSCDPVQVTVVFS